MKYKENYKVGHLVLPTALLFNFKKLFKNADDFLVWQFFYLQATTNVEDLSPSKIAEAIGKTLTETNDSISNLTNEHLLDIKTILIDGKTELYFDVSPLFEKLDNLDTFNKESVNLVTENQTQPNIFKELVEEFERELGRLMSPFELEDLQKLVNEDQVSVDLIKLALREAVFNGKTNWKYITAILRNWRREGLTTVRQVEEQKLSREQKQSKQITISDEFLNAMDLWRD